MKPYAKAKEKKIVDAGLMGQKRQEKALREFKEVLHDLVFMLREASRMETVYLYWINRARRQFVMETKATSVAEIVFQDRVGFNEHFLDAYKDIRQPVTLEVGKEIAPEDIEHYYEPTPVRYITLLPFINNDETVAITVVESADVSFSTDQNDITYAYINALGNVLNTYLEISDLYDQENEWVQYEASLDFLEKKGHYTLLLREMLDTLQSLLEQGGASLVAKGMESWVNVLNSAEAYQPVPVGMPVEERSVAKSALNSGQPEFAIHFNRNPKRISPRELYTKGATLAIPIMFDGFCKGLVMVYDENPLVFKESTKHKLTNIVRLTGLKIRSKLKNVKPDRLLLINDHGALIPDVWERSIDTQIQRLQEESNSYHSWVGMITPSDISQIRTQFRMDELSLMQKDLVRIFNPGQFGISGFIGFHTDYIYLVFVQSKDPDDIKHWSDKVKQKFSTPVQLSNGKQIQTGVNIGFVELDAGSGDSYRVIAEVKRRLS